ncbi:MAG TPA: hypothetical protein DCR93_15525 [Cytophagales bacterium]|nr:hypothetical protein [Cytophagales bacterium]HAP60840.1 hypothetical protein [Cytophagales bacterium]
MTLFEKVKQKRVQLWDHDFAKMMRDTDMPTEARLSCIPHMTFFIMGFKDILFDLQRTPNGDSIQRMVNEHCEEDNGHWQWFLNDLERLQIHGNFLDQGNWQIFAELWSDTNWPIRETVYDAIHLGRLAYTSRLRLLMLEVIEAIFSVYAESIRVLVDQLGWWEKLEFFGRVHYEAENDHSSGSWLDGAKNGLESSPGMKPAELDLAREIVDRMFHNFTLMFDRWHETQNLYMERLPKSA